MGEQHRDWSPARGGLVVELCGLPGSGKTTLAQVLVEGLRSRGVQAEVLDAEVSAAAPLPGRVLRKLAAIGRVVARDPVAEAKAGLMLGVGQAHGRDVVAVPAQWWVAKRLLAEGRRRPGVTVVEEGLVQALWSAALLSEHASVGDLLSLANTAARPDLVVRLVVPLDVAVERLRARSSRHSRIQRMPLVDQVPAMRAGDHLLAELHQGWQRRELSDVDVLDAGADSQVSGLLEALGTLLSTRA